MKDTEGLIPRQFLSPSCSAFVHMFKISSWFGVLRTQWMRKVEEAASWGEGRPDLSHSGCSARRLCTQDKLNRMEAGTVPCMFISPGSNGVIGLLQCYLFSGCVLYLVIYVLCVYMCVLLHARIYRQSSLGEVLIGMNLLSPFKKYQSPNNTVQISNYPSVLTVITWSTHTLLLVCQSTSHHTYHRCASWLVTNYTPSFKVSWWLAPAPVTPFTHRQRR